MIELILVVLVSLRSRSIRTLQDHLERSDVRVWNASRDRSHRGTLVFKESRKVVALLCRRIVVSADGIEELELAVVRLADAEVKFVVVEVGVDASRCAVGRDGIVL